MAHVLQGIGLVALFPGPTQLFVACSMEPILAGMPENEATGIGQP